MLSCSKKLSDSFVKEVFMKRNNYLAVHTYLSDEAKEAITRKPDGRPDHFTDEDWLKTMVFDKAQCLQQWMGSDDFFFCHWSAESEQDIHDALDSVGASPLIQTDCYETKRFVSFFNITGEQLVYVAEKNKKKKRKKKNRC